MAPRLRPGIDTVCISSNQSPGIVRGFFISHSFNSLIDSAQEVLKHFNRPMVIDFAKARVKLRDHACGSSCWPFSKIGTFSDKLSGLRDAAR